MNVDDTSASWIPRQDATLTLGEDNSNLYLLNFRPAVIQGPHHDYGIKPFCLLVRKPHTRLNYLPPYALSDTKYILNQDENIYNCGFL